MKKSSKLNFDCSAPSSLVLNVHVSARSRKDPEPYPFAVEERSPTTNRSATARPVAGIFFPLRPTLRLDSHGFSPTVLGKIAGEAARATSFEDAAQSLVDLAEVSVSGRQVGRIAHELGEQLRDARDQQVEEFQNHCLKPQTVVAPKLAVVSMDGGRLQTRAKDQGPGIHDPGWREDKIANLATMSTQSHEQDPHPELPRCFTKKKEVVDLVKGITSQGAMADVIDVAVGDEPVPLTVFEPSQEVSKPSWQPKSLLRTCVATLQNSEAFGPMVAAEAQRRNLFAAELKAFLGDGGLWIWAIHRFYFPTFEPIVDFVHVLTYVYLAAKAIGGGVDANWERYLRWATACWQGRVAEVLEELREALEGMTPPTESREEKPTDPYHVLSKTIGYFEHNESRMDYPRYRRLGLPVNSSPMESLVKQFNRRVKGTEKFWNADQAETILQLRAAQLSEDDRLPKHLATRTINQFRQYKTTKRRKAG